MGHLPPSGSPLRSSSPAGLRVPKGSALRAAAAGAVLLFAAVVPAATADDTRPTSYVQTNLVSDMPGMAELTDPSLVNAWGMSRGPSTPVWVSDNGMDVATLYSGATAAHPGVNKVGITVSIPDGAPTGQVFNPTTDFVVTNGSASGPARFIFASENGSIDGWNPGVPPPAPSMMAQSAVTVPDAVYKGLAISTGAGGDFLYAADFRHARVEVFDGSFGVVHLAGDFTDPGIPAGYAPFNVAIFGGDLYVTYAKQDAFKHDDVAGQGHGFLDVFDLQGHFMRRLVTHGRLNSPWGLAMAPAGFGTLSGTLLVGNFGDGRINAYDPTTGEFVGALSSRPGKPVVIDGLWGLMFGEVSPPGVSGTPTTLFFSAGPNGEQDGLFGTLTVAP